MKYKFKPFSDNVIFLDTEFSTKDPNTAEILSIGLVKYGGEKLYLELIYEGPTSNWVKENVLPNLKDEKISKRTAITRVSEFVGSKRPFIVSYVDSFDYIYLVKLFGFEKVIELFHWPPIDFASILFGNKINPEGFYIKDKDNFFEQIGVDPSKFKHTHNALDDAVLLREVYLKMTK